MSTEGPSGVFDNLSDLEILGLVRLLHEDGDSHATGLMADMAQLHVVQNGRVPRAWNIPELTSIESTHTILRQIMMDVKEGLEKKYHNKTFKEMTNIVKLMNLHGDDVSTRFIWNPQLGGLVHAKLNVKACDAHQTWTIKREPYKAPWECVQLQFLGLWITPAPIHAMLAWDTARKGGTLQHSALNPVDGSWGQSTIYLCSTCGVSEGTKKCTCRLARYCCNACQKAGWRAHKPLCLWAQSCMFPGSDIAYPGKSGTADPGQSGNTGSSGSRD